MSELYLDIIRKHPIQKEWKPKEGDKFAWDMKSHIEEHLFGASSYDGLRYSCELKEDRFWLPTQEHWQDKLLEKLGL